MAADALIRKKVYRLQSEQRKIYGSFQEALLEMINNHKYLWNGARTKAVLARVDRKKIVPTRKAIIIFVLQRLFTAILI